MEGRTKITKEVLTEEARFILANVMAEAKYGRQNRYDEIQRVCEGAVSIPFDEYVVFLKNASYLKQERNSDELVVTSEGEQVVNGGNLAEFTERAVAHFKKLKASRTQGGAGQLSGGGAIMASGTARQEPQRAGVGGGEVVDARYEKLASIGTGGIGAVYRARQVPLSREVALKEIRELFGFFGEDQRGEIVRRFTDVVRAAAALAHPNIVAIHDVNLERDFPYVVTELAPNGSCRRLITDAEDIPLDVTMRYLLQTLHALRAAHAQRVYHRGLKPEQLLLDGYGNIKVSDFGFSRIVERDHALIRQVYVGMGNVAYMAPELYSDPMAAGAQADIYALGIIFYELLTRKLPGRRSPMPSQVNGSMPREMDDIFDRMTRDARGERYGSVDDVLDDIAKIEGYGAMVELTGVGLGGDPLASIKFRDAREGAVDLAGGRGNATVPKRPAKKP
ncbi:MAG: serine/threonine protein kinase [Myxococcales bacterium]|nr:serine/threonine protein kinase [Myxococcales bacterium]